MLMLIGIPILLKISHIIYSISVYMAADVVFIPFAFRRILSQGNQTLQITGSKIISENKKQYTLIEISNIKSIRYKGVFCVPMSEMMVIESDNMDVIYIDFNFVKYKAIWRHVLEICRQNPDIKIDKQFSKYLCEKDHKLG